MTISTDEHIHPSPCVYYTGLHRNILSRFLLATKWEKAVRNTWSFYLSVGLNFEPCQLLAIETNNFNFFFFDFAFEVHGTRCCMDQCIKMIFFLFCGIKIANHRFLAKNIFAMLEDDDQQKGTNLRKNVRHAHISPLFPTLSLGSTPRYGR